MSDTWRSDEGAEDGVDVGKYLIGSVEVPLGDESQIWSRSANPSGWNAYSFIRLNADARSFRAAV